MILILLLSVVYAWKSDLAYRIKLAGKDELYLVKIDNKMRMIKSVDFESQDDIINAANLLKNKDGSYYVEFCGGLVSAKSIDPGVIPKDAKSELNRWYIERVENGYQFLNGKKCLTKMNAYDDDLKGYYLNTQPCDQYNTNVFSLLDSGYILNFCKKNMKNLCKKYVNDTGSQCNSDEIPYKKRNRRSKRPSFSDTEDANRRRGGTGDDKDPPYRQRPERYDRDFDDYPYSKDSSQRNRDNFSDEYPYNDDPEYNDRDGDEYPFGNQKPQSRRTERNKEKPRYRNGRRLPRDLREIKEFDRDSDPNRYPDYDSDSQYIENARNKTHHRNITEDEYHHH